MNEYRCTFPRYYPKGSLGHNNPSARQGHYVKANNHSELMDKMRDQGLSQHGTVEIQLWYRDGQWVGEDEATVMHFGN
jgi:hypothetical protein